MTARHRSHHVGITVTYVDLTSGDGIVRQPGAGTDPRSARAHRELGYPGLRHVG